MSIETLKMNFKSSDNLCNDLCEKIKNLEINQTQLSKNLDGKNIKFETCKQVVKNILTLYLEEEYFIDSIEKCFKNQELHTEETLKTSKIIKINLVVKLYKYIFNEILKPKLSKYKAFEKIFIEINSINYEFKNLDNFYLFSMRLQTDEENLLNRFIRATRKLEMRNEILKCFLLRIINMRNYIDFAYYSQMIKGKF